MSERRLIIVMSAAGLLALVVSAPANAQTQSQAPDLEAWHRAGDYRCRDVDPDDCYRVAFDPGDRLRLQLGGVWDERAGAVTSWLSTSASLRGSTPAPGDPGGGDFWKRDTRLAFVAGPVSALADHPERLEVSLVRGTYISWSSEPHLTWPSRPPRRLWFPFNPGLEVELGRFSSHPQPGRWGEIGVARASLVLDFLSSPRAGSTAYVTLDFAYDLVGRDAALDRDVLERLESTITPLSAGRFVLHHERQDGLGWVDLRLGAGRRLGLLTDWSTHVEGRMSLARTLFAVNDAPLSVVLDAGVEGAREGDWAWSWRAGLGVELGYDLGL